MVLCGIPLSTLPKPLLCLLPKPRPHPSPASLRKGRGPELSFSGSGALGCRQTCSLKGGERGDVRRPHFVLLPSPSVSFSTTHTRQFCIVYFYEGPWGATYTAPAAAEEEASMGCQCPNVPTAEEVSKRKSLSLFWSGFLTSSAFVSLVSFPMATPSSRLPHPPFLLILCPSSGLLTLSQAKSALPNLSR